MPDQNTDPKTQGQGQTVGTDGNQENQVAFGGSEDFFDDPNFLDKIGQGPSSPSVNVDNQDEKLGDLFEENKPIEPEKINTPNHNIDLEKEKEIEENLEKNVSEIILEPEKKPVVEPVSEIVEPDPMIGIVTSEVNENTIEENIDETVEVKNTEPVKEVVENREINEKEVVAEDEEDDNLDGANEEEKTEEEKPEEEGSGFVKKFNELKKTIREIYDAKNKLGYEGDDFEVIGANSDRNKIVYTFNMEDENNISIKKLETDKKTGEESEHTLSLVVDEGKLNVWMDDMLLFEEIKDLEKDPKKQIQVNDKINKFLFLAGEYNNDMQVELREKLEEEQEKKKMQDIFRNF